MVIVFLLLRDSTSLKLLVKPNFDVFMTKFSLTIKNWQIDGYCFGVINKKVRCNGTKSALVKYQAVKKEGFNSGRTKTQCTDNFLVRTK
jgi:biopolymer transport protein ExbB